MEAPTIGRFDEPRWIFVGIGGLARLLFSPVLCHQCDGIGCFLPGAASGISLLLFLLYIQFAALSRPASLPWQLSAHYRFHAEHRRGCSLLVHGGAQSSAGVGEAQLCSLLSPPFVQLKLSLRRRTRARGHVAGYPEDKCR